MNPELSLKTRREFLRTTTLGGALSWTVPSFFAQTLASLHAQAADAATQIATGKDANILVVVQMAGGNDGLNTLAPFSDDHYFRARPKLALRANQILKVNDTLGFHPSLTGFKHLYDAGQLSVVPGVGYPNPNRSHFRSTEIWQTASEANRYERYGWIGRYFDHACAGADPTMGVSVGRQMPQAFTARRPTGISLETPNSYRLRMNDDSPDDEAMMGHSFRELNQPDANDDRAGDSIGAVAGSAVPFQEGRALDFLERTALDAQISSDTIRAISAKAHTQASYPATRLAQSLKLVARLIGCGLPTRVFYVSQGGYDTHTSQLGAQERLLRELSDAVAAFLTDLRAQGNLGRVLVMTFSEFGRRVAENANGGTDHGAGGLMFLAGGKVRAGLIGRYPSLAPDDLQNGDLRFTTDFRAVYAGILEHWLHTASAPVLGKQFEPVACV